jgi:hypothetical protein
MIDICMMVWNNLFKRHPSVCIFTFIITWCFIFICIILFPIINYWSILSSNSVYNTEEMGKRMEKVAHLTRAQSPMLTAGATVVPTPTSLGVTVVAPTQPVETSRSASAREHPGTPANPPAVYPTPQSSYTPQPTSTVKPTSTSQPVPTPTPTSTPVSTPTVTPAIDAIPTTGSTATPKSTPVQESTSESTVSPVPTSELTSTPAS